MYHYNLKISIFFLETRKSAWFSEVPALKGFTNTYVTNPSFTEENIAASDIIIWAKPINQRDLLFLSRYKKEGAVLVILANGEELMRAQAWIDVADNIWPRILEKDVLQGLYKHLLRNVKTYCDSKLTESYLNALINNMPDMVWFKDLKGIHIKVNDKFCEVVGKKRNQIEGKDHCTIWDIDPEEYKKGDYVCMETEAPVINQKRGFMFEEKVKQGGELHFLNTYKSPVFNKENEVIGTVGYARDITDFWNQGTELRLILNYLPLALMVTDTDDIIKVVNTAFCDIFETRPELVEGKYSTHWSNDAQNNRVSMIRREQKKTILTMVFNYAAENGATLTISSQRKTLQSNEGKIIGYLYSFENLEEERQEAVNNYKKSITDELTGVFNRRHYRAMVSEYVQRGMQFTVAEIDCDDLKHVNDNFGHAMGDDYLQTVVNTIRNGMVKGEALCRIGGDEFVLLSEKKSKNEIVDMLNGVNVQLKNLQLQYPANISFGVENIKDVNFEEYRKTIHYVDQ